VPSLPLTLIFKILVNNLNQVYQYEIGEFIQVETVLT